MGPSFMYVPNAGVEGDYSLNLPDSHIPCMGTSFLHVPLTGVESDHASKLPGSHILCILCQVRPPSGVA